MSKVWVYQDNYRNIGDVRFEISWDTIEPGRVIKNDFDPYRDTISNVEYCDTLLKAKKRANQIFKETTAEPVTSAFGIVQIQKQVVAMNEDTNYAEWENVGDSIEIS